MDLYKVVISKQVRKKDLPKVPVKDRTKIVALIGSLQHEPRPAQALRLTNREEYRIRQGNYRILYIIADEVKVVEVRKVGHRGEVYR